MNNLVRHEPPIDERWPEWRVSEANRRPVPEGIGIGMEATERSEKRSNTRTSSNAVMVDIMNDGSVADPDGGLTEKTFVQRIGSAEANAC